jgi:hypothetical protein
MVAARPAKAAPAKADILAVPVPVFAHPTVRAKLADPMVATVIAVHWAAIVLRGKLAPPPASALPVVLPKLAFRLIILAVRFPMVAAGRLPIAPLAPAAGLAKTTNALLALPILPKAVAAAMSIGMIPAAIWDRVMPFAVWDALPARALRLPLAPLIPPKNAMPVICIGMIPAATGVIWRKIAARTRRPPIINAAAIGFSGE